MNEEMQKEINAMTKVSEIFSAFDQYEHQQAQALDTLREYIYAILRETKE